MDQLFFEIQPTVYFKGARECLFPKIEIPQNEQHHLLVRRAGRRRNYFAEGIPVLQKKFAKFTVLAEWKLSSTNKTFCGSFLIRQAMDLKKTDLDFVQEHAHYLHLQV